MSSSSSSSLSPSPISSLPEEILTEIIARVPRCYYPTLSQVSKRFRSLVFSPELYSRRNILNLAEQSLYVAISIDQTSDIHWFILCRKPNRLLHIRSLPPMPIHGSYVALGSKIFVIGGFHENWTKTTSSVSLIDCRSNTVRSISGMPKPLAGSVTQYVDKKIYVIGGSNSVPPRMMKSQSRTLMVFDLETEDWSMEMRPDWELGKRWFSSVVIDGKIYMRSYYNSFVFDPKERVCEREDVLHTKEWSNSCVIDDVLYYYDVRGKNCLRCYDPKEKVWRVVNGLGEGVLPVGCSWSKTASYGDGRMALFLQKDEIWCAEIKVEKRDDGEVWGEVEWCEVVLGEKFHVMDCVAAMI